MLDQRDKDGFFKSIESLKKYRRADLIDDRGRNLLEKLYTDLLPDNYILRKSIQENTTFLIGRKGTGKSTIFLRIEQEMRKKNNILPCYLDVKTIYESTLSEKVDAAHLEQYIPHEYLEKYLIQRAFIKNILKKIIHELDFTQKAMPLWDRIRNIIADKGENIKEQLKELENIIINNDCFEKIEIPNIKKIVSKKNIHNENNQSLDVSRSIKGKTSLLELGVDISSSVEDDSQIMKSDDIEESFSSIFLQVFQIKEIIEKIKSILNQLEIHHIFILLDDFSEIDDFAIKNFVDVLLAPLNNWSEEFVKFKVAAYPGRVYYGKIDPGKVDIINLDFYNLYSSFNRNKMEEGAIDFTRRLIEKRFDYFIKKTATEFFDISKNSIMEYYEILFKVSMNVPRTIGYILSYCYENKTIHGKLISIMDIENAALRYYKEKIEPFFHKTIYSLMAADEKINILQLKDLLDKFISQMEDINKRIKSGSLTGESYISKEPYTSHFLVDGQLEDFLKTLELNFFISKYTEMSDKDGNLSSIYCLNYGLIKKHNLLWGKPSGSAYRKYFNQRPFVFNKLLKEFLISVETILCTNIKCAQVFTQDQLPYLEFNNFKCNKCASKVEKKSLVSPELKKQLDSLKPNTVLQKAEIDIITVLLNSDRSMTARDIAEELDISPQSIGRRCMTLDTKKGFVIRERIPRENYKYTVTDIARQIYG